MVQFFKNIFFFLSHENATASIVILWSAFYISDVLNEAGMCGKKELNAHAAKQSLFVDLFILYFASRWAVIKSN